MLDFVCISNDSLNISLIYRICIVFRVEAFQAKEKEDQRKMLGIYGEGRNEGGTGNPWNVTIIPYELDGLHSR